MIIARHIMSQETTAPYRVHHQSQNFLNDQHASAWQHWDQSNQSRCDSGFQQVSPLIDHQPPIDL